MEAIKNNLENLSVVVLERAIYHTFVYELVNEVTTSPVVSFSHHKLLAK